MDLSAESINSFLKVFFTNVLYPFLIIVIIWAIIYLIVSIANDDDHDESIRRYTSVFIPLAILVFTLVSDQTYENTLVTWLDAISPGIKLFSGVVTGALLLEAGKQLSKFDLGIGKSLYVLFLSTILNFFLFCFMKQVINSTQTILLGFILGGGLYIVFRGLPFSSNTKMTIKTSPKIPRK